jgi:hypothetical protein
VQIECVPIYRCCCVIYFTRQRVIALNIYVSRCDQCVACSDRSALPASQSSCQGWHCQHRRTMDGLLDFDADYRRALTAPWGPYGRDLTLGVVALASKFLLQVLNSTTVLGHDTYTDLVYKRPPGVGLLTVSNHTRCELQASRCPAQSPGWLALQRLALPCPHSSQLRSCPCPCCAAHLTTLVCRVQCYLGIFTGQIMHMERYAGRCVPLTSASRTSCCGARRCALLAHASPVPWTRPCASP